tara:strand:+ start:629 stop:1789 length:1161 start_codon:yes stop_codon:yes gene_type:complete
MRKVSLLFLVVFSRLGFAQQIDTLVFFSSIFEENRELRIHLPQFYKYSSEKRSLPVIYLLDGQHNWFVNPLLSDIRYLQYTHEIPEAIVVEIPLIDRVEESLFKSLEGEKSALHRFIIEEVDSILRDYRPNKVRVLIGHSFTASFALYSYLQEANFYSAVLAHSPLYKVEKLAQALQELTIDEQNGIYLSIGSVASGKDSIHRLAYDRIRAAYPRLFANIHSYEGDFSGHTSIPIVANPYFLSLLFMDFSTRYNTIAKVDFEYALLKPPLSPVEELQKIRDQSQLLGEFYPPEVPAFNGMISRYWNSDYLEHCKALLQEALIYYPLYYDFHWQLYELYWLEGAEEKAKYHLLEASRLIITMEGGAEDWHDLIRQIDAELEKRNWEP